MFVEQFPVSQRYEVLPIIFSFILIRFLLNQNIFAVLNIGELVSYWFCFSRDTIHLRTLLGYVYRRSIWPRRPACYNKSITIPHMKPVLVLLCNVPSWRVWPSCAQTSLKNEDKKKFVWGGGGAGWEINKYK